MKVSPEQPLLASERLGALLLYGNDRPETIARMYERGELERDAEGLVILRTSRRADQAAEGRR